MIPSLQHGLDSIQEQRTEQEEQLQQEAQQVQQETTVLAGATSAMEVARRPLGPATAMGTMGNSATSSAAELEGEQRTAPDVD